MRWLYPAIHPDHPAVRAWQARLDAGGPGARAPADPAIRATLDANDALFRARRRREARA